MSESETPIDQNTTGGEPIPNAENEVPLSNQAFSGLANPGDEEESLGEDEAEEEDDDDNDDFMAELPQRVRHRVEKMKELNNLRDEIMEDYLKERAALEKKYSDLCKPLYAERAEIIVGKKDQEIADVIQSKKADSTSDGDDDDVGEEDDENLVGVPEFWSCCIHNIEAVSELVTERDNDCLLYLKNVICEDFDDGKGFELQFYFRDNPYFTNECLVKRCKLLLYVINIDHLYHSFMSSNYCQIIQYLRLYHTADEIPNLLLDDEPILKNVTGCEIKWKPGQCLTHREVTKKQRSKSGKRAGQIRTVTKKERTDSFFHFFRYV